jgi:predicted RNase H-like HicB family nuclease
MDAHQGEPFRSLLTPHVQRVQRPSTMKSKDIPRCHASSTSSLRSLDQVTERIREAIELCLEIEGVPGQELEFVGIQRVTIAAGAGLRAFNGPDLIAALAAARLSPQARPSVPAFFTRFSGIAK